MMGLILKTRCNVQFVLAEAQTAVQWKRIAPNTPSSMLKESAKGKLVDVCGEVDHSALLKAMYYNSSGFDLHRIDWQVRRNLRCIGHSKHTLCLTVLDC